MTLPEDRRDDLELFLGAAAGDGAELPDPQTRVERYLAHIADPTVDKPDYPETRIERFLDAIEVGGGGINFSKGRISLESTTQTFSVTHNLGTRKVMIFFWADSGAVHGYTGVGTYYFISDGVIINKMDALIPGYHQINKTDGDVTPWNYPLFIMNAIYTGAAPEILGTTAYSQFQISASTDDDTFSIERRSVNTSYWWYPTSYNWIAVDIGSVME